MCDSVRNRENERRHGRTREEVKVLGSLFDHRSIVLHGRARNMQGSISSAQGPGLWRLAELGKDSFRGFLSRLALRVEMLPMIDDFNPHSLFAAVGSKAAVQEDDT